MDGFTAHRGIRRPRIAPLLASAALASCFAGSSAWAQSQVYKCEDAKGHIQYQNAACDSQGRQMDPSQLRPNATPVTPRPPASEPVREPAREQRVVAKPKAREKAPAASEVAAAPASAPASTATPAATAASKSAAALREEKRKQDQKLQEQQRQEQEKARLLTVTSCDDDGCWDAAGRRYRGTGPTYTRASDGVPCRKERNRMDCP